MYESEFDTDWNDLQKDEALERAFALGVARSLGEPNREEYERILADADTTYRRSLIELAFEEGRTKAANLTADASTDVWDELVVDAAGAGPEPPSGPESAAEGPPDLFSRPEPTVVPDDGLDRIRLPAFLRRR